MSTPLRIIFAGTPEFASVALKALLQSSHQIVAVYTQPDRPSGRGLKLTASPVKTLALQYQCPLFQPANLKVEQDALAKLHADVMVVAAYGLLLPSDVLRTPRFGCINIHPSLLPRWRGAAPIQRAIYAGDAVTGVTIMQMDEGLDTGPILLQEKYTMRPEETSQSLHDKLAVLGSKALIETLDLLAEGKVDPKAQDNDLATYATKISKEEALIDWLRPAVELEREIRAFNPWPVAFTTWQGENLRIWKAALVNHAASRNAEPRTILHASRDGIDIATGIGALRLLAVQLPGGKIMPVSDFFNARQKDLIIGKHFV